MLDIEDTQCCAVRELYNLSSEPDAKTAMKHWVEEEIDIRNDSGYCPGEIGKPIPYTFYTFTGVIKHTDGTRPTQDGKYGPNFASLIRRNRLGKLTESVMRANRVNHPTHYVKIWTWAPSIKNCKRWYRKEFGNG